MGEDFKLDMHMNVYKVDMSIYFQECCRVPQKWLDLVVEVFCRKASLSGPGFLCFWTPQCWAAWRNAEAGTVWWLRAGLWDQMPGLASPPHRPVTLGMSFNFPRPEFPYLWHGDNKITYVTRLLRMKWIRMPNAFRTVPRTEKHLLTVSFKKLALWMKTFFNLRF